jgi:hypothetical protein
MRVTIDRNLCNASLPFCQRCSAAFIRNPEGEDRLCILDVEDDGKETLTLHMLTDNRELEIELTDEQQDIAGIEGWDALADFDPALFRTGANRRWDEIRKLPDEHASV